MAIRKTFRLIPSALLLAALVLGGCSTRTTGPPPSPTSRASDPTSRSSSPIRASGSLGGADLAARLPASGIVRSARIVFVNAEPNVGLGYNDMKYESDKARVFDGALARWRRAFRPTSS